MLKIDSFLKGFVCGFGGFWAVYFAFMYLINVMLWFVTDESEMVYQPIWNIFNLM